MSARAGCLESLSSSVFFQRPVELIIDERQKTEYATTQKIETLIKDIRTRGPLIGLGKIGPHVYGTTPFKLKDQFHSQDIYGWKKDDPRQSEPKSCYVIVLGAKKVGDQELVFFSPSVDSTPNQDDYIRKHLPSDEKIYVISHKTFREGLVDLYSPTVSVKPLEKKTSESKTAPISQDEEYIKKN